MPYENEELRRADAPNDRTALLKKKEIFGGTVTKSRLFPDRAPETESSARRPSVTRKSEVLLSGEKDEEAIPRDNGQLAGIVQFIKRTLDESGIVVVVIIDLDQDIAVSLFRSRVQARADGIPGSRSNVMDSRSSSAQIGDVMIAAVDDDKLCIRICLPFEIADRLTDEAWPVTSRQQSGNERFRR